MKNIFSNLTIWIITQAILSSVFSLLAWAEVSGSCCRSLACSPPTLQCALAHFQLLISICLSVSEDYFSGTAEDTLPAAMASQGTTELLNQ